MQAGMIDSTACVKMENGKCHMKSDACMKAMKECHKGMEGCKEGNMEGCGDMSKEECHKKMGGMEECKGDMQLGGEKECCKKNK
jgi:hypothetical protein